MKLATNIVASACRTILRSGDRELRETFNREDARIFDKVAERIRTVYDRKKERKKR